MEKMGLAVQAIALFGAVGYSVRWGLENAYYH
jgi:hypothetical protein